MGEKASTFHFSKVVSCLAGPSSAHGSHSIQSINTFILLNLMIRFKSTYLLSMMLAALSIFSVMILFTTFSPRSSTTVP